MSIESQCDFSHQHLDSVKVQNVEPQPLSANAEWKAELLERKKVKKLRKKEPKAREQSNEEKGNLEVPADCFEVPLAEVHSVPGPSDSNYDIPDVSLNVSTCVKLVQFSSNEDMSVESQCDLSHQHLDSVKVHDGEPRPVSANSRRLSANAEWQAPKSQRFGRNGSNQNHQAKVEPLQKHKDSVSPVNSRKIWTRKVSVESDDASILEVQKEAIDQKQRSSEVMIGSLSISVKDWSTGRQGNCPVEAGAGSTEPAMPKKCNIVEKPAKHNAFQIGSNRVAAKLYMPVRHEVGRQDPEEGVISLKFDDRTSLHENPLQSCPMDSSGTHKNCQVPDGNAHQGWGFSISVAKAFLAQRWKEAITGDHVMLMRCPDTKFSERPEVPSSSSEIAPTLDSGEDSAVSSVDDLLPKDGVVQSSSSRKNKVKFRPETEKGIKIKYILKPKTHHLGSER
uniref:Zinc finger family protein n=2 Tax=Solanum tuberosum TaxID=4113 RepID=M1CXL7_SOLTU